MHSLALSRGSAAVRGSVAVNAPLRRCGFAFAAPRGAAGRENVATESLIAPGTPFPDLLSPPPASQ
jgi:hypothetical protein